jgi:hypothetical protein
MHSVALAETRLARVQRLLFPLVFGHIDGLDHVVTATTAAREGIEHRVLACPSANSTPAVAQCQ